MRNQVFLAIASFVLVCGGAKASTGVYDFEDLTPGEIIGQDGWGGQVTDGIQPTGTVQTGVGINTTQVLRSTTQVVSFARTEDSLSLDPMSTSATLQFDVLNNGVGAGIGTRAAFFLQGAGGSVSPFFGTFDGRFEYRANANSGSVFSVPLADVNEDYSVDDWYRIRLELNLSEETSRYFVTNLTDGTAEVELLPSDFQDSSGMVPTTLDIANAGSAAGWNTLRLRADRSAVNFNRIFDNLVFEIEDVAALGDFNADGAVNAADYTVFRDSVGTGDLPNSNNDGSTDLSDYNDFVASFATGNSVTVSAVAVPEPATVVAMVAALAVGAAPRRRCV